jgi:hypothetical protein
LINRRVEPVAKVEDFFLEFKHEFIPDKLVFLYKPYTLFHSEFFINQFFFLLSSCTSHDMKYIGKPESKSLKRLTAIGCQNGWLGVYLIDVSENRIKNLYINLNLIIVEIRIYNYYKVI